MLAEHEWEPKKKDDTKPPDYSQLVKWQEQKQPLDVKDVVTSPYPNVLRPPNAPSLSPPSAPSTLTVTSEPTPITPVILRAIIETLRELDDGDIIVVARTQSYEFYRSIYNWITLRGHLLNKPDKYSKDLTIKEVRQLDKYEYPPEIESRKLQEGGRRIPLSLTNIEVGLVQATILVEAALIGALFYFWLFQSEAVYSPSFPAPATLFGAISRTRTSYIGFFIFILTPFFTTALVAWESFPDSYINFILAVFVLILTLLILLRTYQQRDRNTNI